MIDFWAVEVRINVNWTIPITRNCSENPQIGKKHYYFVEENKIWKKDHCRNLPGS